MGYSSVLVIPDLHTPYEHQDAFHFIHGVIQKYCPDKIVLTGDEIDYHGISFHDKDPDLPFSPSAELSNSIMHLEQLYTIIPNAIVMESNHGSLVYRKMKYHGIPKSVIKSYKEILQAPNGWEWKFEYFCKLSNGRVVYFHHGHSKNVLTNSKAKSLNYVQGHHHGTFDIQYWNNGHKVYWGMTVGCLVDQDSLAFAYGKNNLHKPLLGCGIILDGSPKLIPMILDKHKRWNGKII